MTERLNNNHNCGLRTALSEWLCFRVWSGGQHFPQREAACLSSKPENAPGPEYLKTPFPSDKGGLFGPPHIVSY